MKKTILRIVSAIAASAIALTGLAAPSYATATGLLWSAYGSSDKNVGVAGYQFTLRTSLAGDLQYEQVPSSVHGDVLLDANSLFNFNGNGVVWFDLVGPSADATQNAANYNPEFPISFDVFVIDSVTGQRSETERVTFIPPQDVQVEGAISPVQAFDGFIESSFSLTDVNTANFLISNNLVIDSEVLVEDSSGNQVFLLDSSTFNIPAVDGSYSVDTQAQNVTLADSTIISGFLPPPAQFTSWFLLPNAGPGGGDLYSVQEFYGLDTPFASLGNYSSNDDTYTMEMWDIGDLYSYFSEVPAGYIPLDGPNEPLTIDDFIGLQIQGDPNFPVDINFGPHSLFGPAPGDSLKLSLYVWDGQQKTEINQFFDQNRDAFSKVRSISDTNVAAQDHDGMDITIGESTSLRHNATAEAALIPAETVVALEGTKSLTFTISLYSGYGTANQARAGRGNEVTVTLHDLNNGLDTTTIKSEGTTLSKAGSTVSFTKVTNSSGQISFTVTADNAEAGESFAITAQSTLGVILDAGDPVDGITYVQWQEATWNLLPALPVSSYTIKPQGTLSVDYLVVDQFGNLANSDYQLTFVPTAVKVTPGRDTLAEYANWSYAVPVSAQGRATLTITDNGADAEGKDNVKVSLQKKATAGGFLAVTGVEDTFVINYENDLKTLTATAKVNYDGLTKADGTAAAPILIETDPLSNFDVRLNSARPTKWDANNHDPAGAVVTAAQATGLLRVFGTVLTTNNAPAANVAVKISGTGLNFADEPAVADMTRAANDSIVVFTDATGSYEAFVRSSVAGRQTISIDAQGTTASVPVRFQTSTGTAATVQAIVGPSAIIAGTTADFKVTVVDKLGAPVPGAVVTFKEFGPGYLSGTTNDRTTDAFGEAVITVLTTKGELGKNTLTATATIAGQAVVLTKDFEVVATAAGVTGGKVNVGSFNGKLVVYASGLNGSTISWKVGGNWGKAVATSDFARFDRPTPRRGVTVSVQIYVDGVLTLTKSVVTR